MQVPDKKHSILLVTPVWNDSARLAVFGPRLAGVLAQANLPIQWVVADDGSSAEEVRKVESLVADFAAIYPAVEMLSLRVRSRKGRAVYKAWNAHPDAEWVSFVDADGAVTAEDMLRIIRRAVEMGEKTAVIGIRHDSPDTPVHRPFTRILSFKLFAFLVHRLVGIRFEDTQCGAKVVPGAVYRAVADRLQETGFVFDVELLVAILQQGCAVEEMPIPWEEMAGGKVKPIRESWAMMAGLWRIRKRVRAGGYRGQEQDS